MATKYIWTVILQRSYGSPLDPIRLVAGTLLDLLERVRVYAWKQHHCRDYTPISIARGEKVYV